MLVYRPEFCCPPTSQFRNFASIPPTFYSSTHHSITPSPPWYFPGKLAFFQLVKFVFLQNVMFKHNRAVIYL